MQFTPRNAEYPLQGTESEEKEEKYEKHIEESQKESKHKRCLLILGLKPFRSQVKEMHSAGKKFENLAVRGFFYHEPQLRVNFNFTRPRALILLKESF